MLSMKLLTAKFVEINQLSSTTSDVLCHILGEIGVGKKLGLKH